MNKKLPVSVIISAYNEEKMIDACLQSVAWADQVIVIDNESTDHTKAVARKHTSYVFSRPNNPMLNVNKNYGFAKATHEWILSLDADERVTEELHKEIETIVTQDEVKQNGFWIPRKNIIFGKWIEHAGWYPDHQLRLFKRTKGKFAEEHVHEMISLKGESGYLNHPLIHENYASIAQFLRKTCTIYAPNEAEQLMKNKYEFSYMDALRFPAKEFFSRYFAREGYKDGFHGLMLSLLMAFYHFVVFALVWEANTFKQAECDMVLSELDSETKKLKKDFRYWIFRTKSQKTSKQYKKVFYKVMNKLHR